MDIGLLALANPTPIYSSISDQHSTVSCGKLFPDEEYPSSLVAALHRLRVSSADIDHMLEVTSTDDATAGVSDHFRRLLKDALTNTHFFIRGLDAPCRTHRGTRPGDPLGDLLYNMVMSLILRDARNLIHKATGVFGLGVHRLVLISCIPMEFLRKPSLTLLLWMTARWPFILLRCIVSRTS